MSCGVSSLISIFSDDLFDWEPTSRWLFELFDLALSLLIWLREEGPHAGREVGFELGIFFSTPSESFSKSALELYWQNYYENETDRTRANG